MTGPWRCENTDTQGVCVFEEPGATDGHPSELDAWKYGLDCLVGRRAELVNGIKDARAEVLRLERKSVRT